MVGAQRHVDELDGVCQESIDWKIGLLNQLSDSNPDLPFPHSSQLKGTKYRAFRELRADCGRTHYRIIFRRSERFFILLHIIHKNTGEPQRKPRRPPWFAGRISWRGWTPSPARTRAHWGMTHRDDGDPLT